MKKGEYKIEVKGWKEVFKAKINHDEHAKIIKFVINCLIEKEKKNLT